MLLTEKTYTNNKMVLSMVKQKKMAYIFPTRNWLTLQKEYGYAVFDYILLLILIGILVKLIVHVDAILFRASLGIVASTLENLAISS